MNASSTPIQTTSSSPAAKTRSGLWCVSLAAATAAMVIGTATIANNANPAKIKLPKGSRASIVSPKEMPPPSPPPPLTTPLHPPGPGRWSPGTEVLLGSASVTDRWREAVQRQSRAYFPAVACWPGGGGSAQFLRPLQDRAKPDAWSP